MELLLLQCLAMMATVVLNENYQVVKRERWENIFTPCWHTLQLHTVQLQPLGQTPATSRSYLQLHWQHRFLTMIKLMIIMIKLDWCFEFSSHYLEFVSMVWWSVNIISTLRFKSLSLFIFTWEWCRVNIFWKGNVLDITTAASSSMFAFP